MAAPKKMAQPKPAGKPSIYKGTDKSTSTTKPKKSGNEVTYKTQPKGALSGIGKLVLDPFSDYSKKTTVKTSRGR